VGVKPGECIKTCVQAIMMHKSSNVKPDPEVEETFLPLITGV